MITTRRHHDGTQRSAWTSDRFWDAYERHALPAEVVGICAAIACAGAGLVIALWNLG